MRKRILSLCLLFLLVISGFSAADSSKPLVLAVSSDLHFSQEPSASVYSMMSRVDALANAMADQVIDLHPDAFILCGDNTNSGRQSDAEALSDILGRIRDAGIPVIIITGNHDLDLGDPESFKAVYSSLCPAEERDTASLSYMLHVGPVRILAMDDNSFTSGQWGAFSEKTMTWLRNQLSEAELQGEPVLFLSHHNVLPGGEEAKESSYTIRNPELRDLLADHGVILCLSGHRHSQDILYGNGLYEIVSAMPGAFPHLFGTITISDGKLAYRAEPLKLSEFGKAYGLDEILAIEQEEGDAFSTVAERLPGWADSSAEEQAAAKRRFALFMGNYAGGTLADVQEEIVNDPFYPRFLALFRESNYGAWMQYLLESDILAGNRLELDISDWWDQTNE